jgi:hypothetical protein
LKLDPLFEGSRKKELTRVASNTCTQTVTVRRHGADVSVTSGIESCPGGAGSVGVVVKISHRLGIQTDAVVTPTMFHCSIRSISLSAQLIVPSRPLRMTRIQTRISHVHPDGKHPSARNATPAMLLRGATRRSTAGHVVAHPGPSDSE